MALAVIMIPRVFLSNSPVRSALVNHDGQLFKVKANDKFNLKLHRSLRICGHHHIAQNGVIMMQLWIFDSGSCCL